MALRLPRPQSPRAPSAAPARAPVSPTPETRPRTDSVHRKRLAAAFSTARGWNFPYDDAARFCGSMTVSPGPCAAQARTRAHPIHSPAPTAPTPTSGQARRHAGPGSERSRTLRAACHATAAIRKTPV